MYASQEDQQNRTPATHSNILEYPINENLIIHTSLAVQGLRLCTPNTGGRGSIPDKGTKILHVAQCPENEPTNQTKKPNKNFILFHLLYVTLPTVSLLLPEIISQVPLSGSVVRRTQDKKFFKLISHHSFLSCQLQSRRLGDINTLSTSQILESPAFCSLS